MYCFSFKILYFFYVLWAFVSVLSVRMPSPRRHKKNQKGRLLHCPTSLLYYVVSNYQFISSSPLLCSSSNCILVLLLHYHFLWCAVVLIEGSSIFVHINRTHFAYFLLIGRVGMINRLWKLLWLLLLFFIFLLLIIIR